MNSGFGYGTTHVAPSAAKPASAGKPASVPSSGVKPIGATPAKPAASSGGGYGTRPAAAHSHTEPTSPLSSKTPVGNKTGDINGTPNKPPVTGGSGKKPPQKPIPVVFKPTTRPGVPNPVTIKGGGYGTKSAPATTTRPVSKRPLSGGGYGTRLVATEQRSGAGRSDAITGVQHIVNRQSLGQTGSQQGSGYITNANKQSSQTSLIGIAYQRMHEFQSRGLLPSQDSSSMQFTQYQPLMHQAPLGCDMSNIIPGTNNG